MELDTGASLSVISEETYKSISQGNGKPLEQTEVKLCTYSGESLPVMGYSEVEVEYQ